MPFGHMFDIVWSGRRHVMMGATQVDRFGNQNIACIGPWAKPKAQLLGVRGAPGNTVNNPTRYWVPAARDARVRRAGRLRVRRRVRPRRRGRARARRGSTRSAWSCPTRPSSTSTTPDHAMRIRSVHPGVTVDDVVESTGFPLVVPDDVPVTRAPDRRGPAADPRRPRPGQPAQRRGSRVTHAALHTPLCELFGVEYPIVQTGMGWVAGASLASATSNAGGLGILAGATMTFEQLRDAIHTVKDRTGNPFGVNLRPDQPDLDDRVAMIVREGVQRRELRPAAAQGRRRQAARRRPRRDADDRGETPRREGRGARRRRGHRAGR